jgi:hypothetical protein
MGSASRTSTGAARTLLTKGLLATAADQSTALRCMRSCTLLGHLVANRCVEEVLSHLDAEHRGIEFN